MAHPASRLALLVLLATACTVEPPPPPVLRVTTPARGMVQSESGRITVSGTAVPGPSGEAVREVKVNDVVATLAADGAFTATVDLPPGAMLLETVATSTAGSSTTDARAVHVGQRQAVGGMLDRALTASLSADAFARLAAAAGPYLKGKDLGPSLPVTSFGNTIGNVKVTVGKLVLGDVKLTLAPVDGGLAFTAEVTALDALANARYASLGLSDASNIKITADKVVVSGTMRVTPAGVTGFTIELASPTIATTKLVLDANGVTGVFLDLLQSELASTVRGWIKTAAERALGPLLNDALGALAGPKTVDVAGKQVELQAAPSALLFSKSGALVTLNLGAKIRGGDASFIFTPNGTPNMNVGNGVTLGLSDDLVNQLLAQVHALKLLDFRFEEDFGIFDVVEIKPSLPPMISANNADGSLRLVLGDMVATFSDDGKPVIAAAVNAQIDLEIERGKTDQEVALAFGEISLYVNILEDKTGMNIGDLSGPAGKGIGLQLENLEKFMLTVPVPAVAGVTLDGLALRADHGYVLVSGQVH